MALLDKKHLKLLPIAALTLFALTGCEKTDAQPDAGTTRPAGKASCTWTVSDKTVPADDVSTATLVLYCLDGSKKPAVGSRATISTDLGEFVGVPANEITETNLLSAGLDKTGRYVVRVRSKNKATGPVNVTAVTVIGAQNQNVEAKATFTFAEPSLVTPDGGIADAADAGPSPKCGMILKAQTPDGKDFPENKPVVLNDSLKDAIIVAEPTDVTGRKVGSGVSIIFVVKPKNNNPETEPGGAAFRESNGPRAEVVTDDKGQATVRLFARPTDKANTTVFVSATYNCLLTDTASPNPDGGQSSRPISPSMAVQVEQGVPVGGIKISLSENTILANGQMRTTVTAEVTEGSGAAATKPKEELVVTFNTTAGTFRQSGAKDDANTTVGGLTQVELIADTKPGTAVVTAAVQIKGVNLTDSTIVRMINLGALRYVNATPPRLGLKNSGFNETSQVCFRLTGNLGEPLPDIPVNFDISKAPGDVEFSPKSKISDVTGVACTTLFSGFIPTTVVVTARSTVGQDRLEARSDPILMSGGQPSARYLNFQCAAQNVGAFIRELREVPCTVTVADRYSNQIEQEVPVFFRTEAGTMPPVVFVNPGQRTGSAGTTPAAGGAAVRGVASVDLRVTNPLPRDVEPLQLNCQANPPTAQEPVIFESNLCQRHSNPRDGLVTLIAATTGQEEFDDKNGNGKRDQDEPFVDLPEPFVDANDNNKWDFDEEFIDADNNKEFSPPNGFYDDNTIIWTQAHMMWTNELVVSGKCDDMTKSHSIACPSKLAVRPTSDGSEFSIGDGGSAVINYQYRDKNLNPPNSTARVTQSLTGGGVITARQDGAQPDTLGLKVSRRKLCDGPQIVCTYQYDFFDFEGGYKGVLEIKDNDPGSGQLRDTELKIENRYLEFPSLAGRTITNNTQRVATLTVQGVLDDPNASGPCSMKLDIINAQGQPPYNADGRSVITFEASPINSNNQIETKEAVTFRIEEGGGRFQQSGTTQAPIIPNAQGKARVDYLVPNQDGQLTIRASFRCNNLVISRTRVLQMLPGSGGEPVPRISLSSTKPTVVANGSNTVTINARVTKGDGTSPTDAEKVKVEFKVLTPNAKLKNPITGSQVDSFPVDVRNAGAASIDLVALCDSGNVEVQATTAIGGQSASDKISLSTVKLGGIQTLNIEPAFLGTKGSGVNEVVNVSFLVTDTEGRPFTEPIGVSFSTTTIPGGASLLNTIAFPDKDGVVRALVRTGTVATSFSVTAKATQEADAGKPAACTPTVSSASPAIPIVGVKPNARTLTLSCAKKNIPGLATNFIETNCTFSMGDRFTNKIAIPTNINFYTEAGVIDPFVTTQSCISEVAGSGVTGDSCSIATIKLRTSSPRPKDVRPCTDAVDNTATCSTPTSSLFIEPIRAFRTPFAVEYRNPRDGLVSLVAATIGEEEFFDDNGNGEYDTNERFVDLGEPFVDANDNNYWDEGEVFMDVDQNGSWTQPNQAWDSNTIIWTSSYMLWTGELAIESANTTSVVYERVSQINSASYTDSKGQAKELYVTVTKDLDCRTSTCVTNRCSTILAKLDGPPASTAVGRIEQSSDDGESLAGLVFQVKEGYFRKTDEGKYLSIVDSNTLLAGQTALTGTYVIKSVQTENKVTLERTGAAEGVDGVTWDANLNRASLKWALFAKNGFGQRLSSLCTSRNFDFINATGPHSSTPSTGFFIANGSGATFRLEYKDQFMNPMDTSLTASLTAESETIKVTGKAEHKNLDTMGVETISTTLCGNDRQTFKVWQDIAKHKPKANPNQVFDANSKICQRAYTLGSWSEVTQSTQVMRSITADDKTPTMTVQDSSGASQEVTEDFPPSPASVNATVKYNPSSTTSIDVLFQLLGLAD